MSKLIASLDAYSWRKWMRKTCSVVQLVDVLHQIEKET